MAFRLNCVSELYKNLGRYDAIVEFTEIAIRDFITKAEEAGEFDAFLQAKSIEHKIEVNTVDQNIYRSRTSQSYILSVYQTAELFLHQFRDEYNDLFDSSWKLDDTKDNLLIKTIRKISPVNPAKILIGEHRVQIFNYYRIVRNKYSHDRINESKVEDAFEEICKYSGLIEADYSGLVAPNNFDNISFDDFILFSRTIKDIAYKLNEIAKPSDEQLMNFYSRKDFYKELNQNAKRKTNALKGHLLSTFGIEANQAEQILTLLPVPLA